MTVAQLHNQSKYLKPFPYSIILFDTSRCTDPLAAADVIRGVQLRHGAIPTELLKHEEVIFSLHVKIF